MKIRIIGELDSVDRAELAARSIRDQIKDVYKININERKQGVYQNYYTTPLPNFSSGGLFYSSVVLPTAYNRLDDDERVEVGREAELEIICEENDASRVISKLHAHGGVKIRKLYGRNQTK